MLDQVTHDDRRDASPSAGRAHHRLPQAAFQASVLPLADALPLWNSFSQDDPYGVAQSLAWVCAWAETVNPDILVGVISAGGQPALLLPLEIVTHKGVRIARYAGGTHANANFPVVSKALAGSVSERLIYDLLAKLKAHPGGPDALVLTRQLSELQGVKNPLLVHSTMESANLALSFFIDTDFENLIKHRSGPRKLKKMRQQARRMDERGSWTALVAKDAATSDMLLDTFFAMKAKRFEKLGLNNTFADPRIVQFFKTLFARASATPDPAFKLDALKVGNEILAVAGSAIRHGSNIVEFGAVWDHEPALSPGDFLFHQMINKACDEKLIAFDFGVGDEPYKRSWCDVETRHADSMAAFTAKGAVYVMLFRLAAITKRMVKRNDRLFTLLKKWRRRKAPAPGAQE